MSYPDLARTVVGVLSIWIGFALVGCASSSSSSASSSSMSRSGLAPSLLGKTRQQLVDCAGFPEKTLAAGEMTLLIYGRAAPSVEESFMNSKSSVRLNRPHGCRARLALKDDRVEGIEYDPFPADFPGEDHCDEIFQACGQ